MIYVVVNEKLKEFWVADYHYENRINDDIKYLKGLYGEDNITYYHMDIKYLSVEKENLLCKNYKERHYIDWTIVR